MEAKWRWRDLSHSSVTFPTLSAGGERGAHKNALKGLGLYILTQGNALGTSLPRYLCLFLIMLFTLWPWLVAGAEQSVLIVQSAQIAAYEEAATAFIRALGEKVESEGKKSITSVLIETMVLNGKDDPTSMRERMGQPSSPSLLVAIGRQALAFTAEEKKIPILYLLTPDAGNVAGAQPNITGIRLDIPARIQLAAMRLLLPKPRTFLPYDPKKTDHFVRAAVIAAQAAGIPLITSIAATSHDIPRLLPEMSGHANLFWMVPDTTVLTQENIDLIITQSLAQGIAVFTFTDKFLAQGAMAALTVPPTAMGTQAAAIARRLLAGEMPTAIRPADPDRLRITLNSKIMKKIGITIPNLPSSLRITSEQEVSVESQRQFSRWPDLRLRITPEQEVSIETVYLP